MTSFDLSTNEQEPVSAPASSSAHVAAGCTSCGNGSLAPENVKAAFWEGEQLVIVDNIPAFVCQSCGEKYYEDETAMKLDFLRGTGFPPDKAAGAMSVPVFNYDPLLGMERGG
ncbi:type II toxin-antitoxin system MqsA family antitoxin [Roseibium sp.]|uniref:type II toxin-antitoxin system MqsA family antitoxin n=1 Tax=Roseibium sp. TaxID=1936156 RepID=UPI003A97F70D